MQDRDCDEHPWYLDLCPDPVRRGHDGDALAALQELDRMGAVVVAVHADIVPSLADLIARRCYIGWTIVVPGSVERIAIERIAATAGAGYQVRIVPGHPLPPTMDVAGSPTLPYHPARPPEPHIVGRA